MEMIEASAGLQWLMFYEIERKLISKISS